MRNAVLVGAVLSLLGAGAQAQGTHLVVRAGAPILVYKIASINPDCSSLGPATVNLVRAPQGGEASVGERRDYVAFIPGNPRSACNRRKVAATEIFYRSAPGFSGYDSFSAEIIAPNGVAQTRTFTVEVR
jgi:hypothetical protein